ncbi:MAG: DUF1287 domain-containing protein [Gammaproteobacteria bacterium]|nr:DUF1287 domain-containing protein [Gammaproteobacteria bacterium]
MIQTGGFTRLFFVLWLGFAGCVHGASTDIDAHLTRDNASAEKLLRAAYARTQVSVVYDGQYQRIDYPMGDVPNNIGVCTDLIIRTYRQLGIDLQVRVHEDMRNHFAQYPNLWGMTQPDRNIDHRRVPNLERFFSRYGVTLPLSSRGEDYRPGDIVTWRLANGLPHIGLISADLAKDGKTPLVIHNIGAGPQLENSLFEFTIVGHFRYFPEPKE